MSHAVQFYQEDIYLIDAVSAFIEAGFQEKATSIVIATPQHREELRARLQKSGQSGAESRVLFFDAEDLLLGLRQYHAGGVIQRPARDSPRIVQCME